MLKERGFKLVSRLNKAHRKADFRKGKRLSPDDHIVCWQKPTSIRSVDRKTYNSLPDDVMIREVRIRIEQSGFQTKSMVVVTTLLDPEQASKAELAYLYRASWNNELDLRAIKSTMQMESLHYKTTERVRKEVQAHVLAYNLIRTIIAQAATKHEIEPRSISFKGTIQTLEAFQPLIAHHNPRSGADLSCLYEQLLDAIAKLRLPNIVWATVQTASNLDSRNDGTNAMGSSENHELR